MGTAESAQPFCVPALSGPEEQGILSRITENPPHFVLVASDFHIGEGRNPLTGRIEPRENFLADEVFADWLGHYRQEAAKGALLLLNGDTFDFIRITRIPKSRKDFEEWALRLERIGEGERAKRLRQVTEVDERQWGQARRSVVSKREEWFGLRADDYKTVWKLHVIIRGHEAFFQALADWVGWGGRLLFVKGNHDVELFWPLVHRTIRGEVVTRIIEKRSEDPGEEICFRIAFANKGFTMANLYVEHGHRHESMTSVFGGEVLEESPWELNLPLGSFLNRYFLNQIERLDPYIDNVVPTHQALLRLLRERPYLMVMAYLGAWRFALRALRVPKGRSEKRAVRRVWAVLLLPPASMAVYAAHWIWPASFMPYPWWFVTLGFLATFFSPAALPYLVGFLEGLLSRRSDREVRDPLVEGARKVLRRVFPWLQPGAESHDGVPPVSRVYAVFGHRHTLEVIDLGGITDDGTETFYANSGTWIPLWPINRPDLRGNVIYSYLEYRLGTDGEYGHRSLVWDDEARTPETATESQPSPIG